MIICNLIKEKYTAADELSMNLHEECLLKYLTNPLDLLRATETLKTNNNLLEKAVCENKYAAIVIKVSARS